jgi:hypothetical protein
MDSTIIDGRDLTGTWEELYLVIIHAGQTTLKNLHFIGYPTGITVTGRSQTTGINISECLLESGEIALLLWGGVNRAENLIIKNVQRGVSMLGDGIYDIHNNFISLNRYRALGLSNRTISSHSVQTFTNNIIINYDNDNFFSLLRQNLSVFFCVEHFKKWGKRRGKSCDLGLKTKGDFYRTKP